MIITQAVAFEQRVLKKRALLPIEQEETAHTPSVGIPIVGARKRKPTPIELEETLLLPSICLPVLRMPKGVQSAAAAATTSSQPSSGSQALAAIHESAKTLPDVSSHSLFRARPTVTSTHLKYAMERKERVVLMLLDGKRTLQEVASLLHRNELDIAQVLAHFVRNGYIDYCGTKNVEPLGKRSTK